MRQHTRFLSRVAAGAAAAIGSIGLLFAAAVPAHAAAMTNISITTSSPLVAGQTNPAPIIVTFTSPTQMPLQPHNSAVVNIMNATWVTAPVNYGCGSLVSVSNDQSLVGICASNASGPQAQAMITPDALVPANTTWTMTFAANTINVPNAANLNFSLRTFVATGGGATYDSSTATLAITGYTPSSKSVTFDANGGTGTMTTQSGSAAAALTANAFTRSGYSFSGWNTAADGTGTAYADGASYAFTANATLYAQWTPSLATTGFESGPMMALFAFGLVAVSAGAALLARTRRS